jgi:hypothetical protein
MIQGRVIEAMSSKQIRCGRRSTGFALLLEPVFEEAALRGGGETVRSDRLTD